MKHSKQIAAAIMSTAFLLQNAGMMPLFPAAPALTASAATAQVNHPRTFEYDFHTFRAQYDPVTDQWFTAGGHSLRSETQAVQETTSETDSDLKLTLNFAEQTASVSKSGETTDCSALFRDLLYEPLAGIRPEYETGLVYDRITQQYYDRPEPKSFPLTFTCAPQFRNSAPASLTCDIRFGEEEYGTLGISTKGDLFSGAENGSVQIQTAAALHAAATVTPGTCAGDANFDRRLDVSDAVLTCRIAAEDITARITDIGRVLADQNLDNRIDGSDISDILYDIAGVPAENRIPTGSVQVISVEKLGQEEMNDIFEYETSTGCTGTTRRVPGEQYDTWYFAYSEADDGSPDYGSYAFNVNSLTLAADGTLCIKLDSSDAYSRRGFAMIAVTVPHDALPADTIGSMIISEVSVLPRYSPVIRYIAVEPPPENAIPIIRLEQPAPQRTAEDWEALAAALGYANGSQLEQNIRKRNYVCLTEQNCTAGEKLDVWDMACFLFNSEYEQYPEPESAGIESLMLYADDHTLDGLVGMYMHPGVRSSEPDDFIWLWFRITVPHGSIPEDAEVYLNPEARYYTAATPNARYIPVYTPEKPDDPNHLSCWEMFESGLHEAAADFPEDIRAELEAPGAWYTTRFYTAAEQVPPEEKAAWYRNGETPEEYFSSETEFRPYLDSKEYDLLCVYLKTPADENGGYFSEYGVERAELKNGILTLKIAEYRPLAQADVPAHYDRLLIPVPKNGLNGMTEVRAEKLRYYDDIIECTSGAAEQPDAAAVRGQDGEWHWEEAVYRKDQFLAATKAGEPFAVTGDIPEESYLITAEANISVVNYATGETLPGYGLEIRTNGVYADPFCNDPTVLQTWTTTDEPVRHLTLYGKRFNYGYHSEIPDFTVTISGTPAIRSPYYFPSYLPTYCKEIRIAEDGSTIDIVLYVIPTNGGPNVHFTFRDWSTGENTLDFTAEIAGRTQLTVCDTAGNELYYTCPWDRFDCALPDGTYIAKLDSECRNYTFADPDSPALKALYSEEELKQISGSDTITFTVRNGEPDQAEYCFDMMLKPEIPMSGQ